MKTKRHLVGKTTNNDCMKPNLGFNGRNRGRELNCAAKPTQRTGKPEAPNRDGIPDRFRRLKWNELVRHGDFVANGDRSFEPWEGPNGFRADAYVKPIYRRWECRPNGDKKAR